MPYQPQGDPRLQGSLQRNEMRRKQRLEDPRRKEAMRRARLMQFASQMAPVAGAGIGAAVGGIAGGPAGAATGMKTGGSIGGMAGGVGQAYANSLTDPYEEQDEQDALAMDYVARLLASA